MYPLILMHLEKFKTTKAAWRLDTALDPVCQDIKDTLKIMIEYYNNSGVLLISVKHSIILWF